MQTKNVNVDQAPSLDIYQKMGQFAPPPLPPRVGPPLPMPIIFSPITAESLTSVYYGGGGLSAGAYKPVPPPRPVGATAAVAGRAPGYVPPPSPGPQLLHTHSSKFPIERELTIGDSDKTAKTPVYMRTPVLPEAPPRLQAAWTSNNNYGMQQQDGFRQAAGPSSRPQQPQLDGSQHPPPPTPLKQTFIYGKHHDDVDAKETSKTKAMTKTYHTLKDMISSRFKGGGGGKDAGDSEQHKASSSAADLEQGGLNNVADEMRKSAIYGRTQQNQQQQRIVGPDLQYGRHMVQINGGFQNQQQQYIQQQQQQQLLMSPQQSQPGASSTPQHGLVQARSQELLARQQQNNEQQRPHSQLLQLNEGVYYQPQYGQNRPIAGGRTVVGNYQGEVAQNGNYSGMKQQQQQQAIGGSQIDSGGDGRSSEQLLRSPQQLEREILRQHQQQQRIGLAEGRRTASQPQLPLDDHHAYQQQQQLQLQQQPPTTTTSHQHQLEAAAARRGSHGNLLLDGMLPNGNNEKDSDDGGFRTPRSRSTRSRDDQQQTMINKQPSVQQQQQHQGHSGEDGATAIVKKAAAAKNPGSTASSDYDKNGGPSSNVDSGRGSAAYSSGRRVGNDTSTESDPLPGPAPGRSNQNNDHSSSSKLYHEKNGESEWVDIVESELRQILEPKLHALNVNGNNANPGGGIGNAGSETVSSVTPPMPPITPNGSSPDGTPRNSNRFKHQSLPYGSKPDFSAEARPSMPNQRAGWQPHSSKHRNGSSKKQEHSSQYKKHMFGLENDMTSTTTRSLDLSSMLDGQSDSDVSTQDARAIRRQLQGLENMYCEVLKLLGVRKPSTHNLGKYQPSDSRLAKRRYGSVSSLPSSSVSSRPIRDKRRTAGEQRKKVNDIKGINKRFQRLESHVVTLARSVAHLSSEMRTQHLMIQEMENIRGEITALRNQQRSQSMPRIDANFSTANGYGGVDASSLANPCRVKKLTKFFGDEPPLLRMFLKKLGYEKYASLLENERVGAAELPFLGEERLRALGVPLGPRLRILHEARLALPPSNDTAHTTLCIV